MKTMTLLLSFLSISTFASAVHYDPTLPTPLHSVPLHVRKAYRRRDDRNLLGSELTPLYPGYGTHISYIYVGTPPQRQSVIIDTGSSYTAFPCEGCQNCGQHTDNYFYPSNSSTSVVAKCGKSTCSISQSYSEGSSWQAYKITDKLWVGGLAPGLVKNANDYAIDFMFGCQTSETGLFRTQLADGIMGMSSSSNTLMPQLFEKKLVDNKIFALCFRIGGGIMTLGGVDQRIHSSDVSYAKLYPSSSNWFRVNILELSLVEMSGPGKSTQHNISGAASAMNAGSGTIVDSGTTDTYLPSKLKDSFEKAFLAVTGIRYTAGTPYTLTSAQVKSLPDIKITMRDEAGTGSFDLYFPVSAYADDENGKYAFRIYLTESSGAVLGANFMRGRNIIFDSDGGRVGFALSSCKYEDYEGIPFVPPEPPMVLPPLPVPIDLPKDKNNCTMEPAGYCTAVCNETSDKSYQVSGVQTFYDECTNQYEKRTCVEFCRNDNTLARGVSYDCIDSHWSECDHTCNQHREVAYISKENKCSHKKEERSCATDLCPQDTKDFFVFADLKFWYPAAVAPRHWEKIYEEDLFSALSILLKIPPGNMDLLVDVEAREDSSDRRLASGYRNRRRRHLAAKRFVKLQLQIVISRKLYARVEYFNNAVTFIMEMLDQEGFRLGKYLMPELEHVGQLKDKDNIYRYSMLFPEDMVVQRAVALPMGGSRDPFNIPNANPTQYPPTSSTTTTGEYFLIGVAMGSIVIVVIVMVLYCRLRAEFAAMAKDKVLSSGTSIIQMLKKVSRPKSKPETHRQYFPKARDGSASDLLGEGSDEDENGNEFGL